MITNVQIKYTAKGTEIFWNYCDMSCHFIDPKRVEYEEVINWLNYMTREDQEEHFITEQPEDYVELLGCIVSTKGRFVVS